MIADICAFILCFFFIMTNIKKIESASNNQINPIQFQQQTFHPHYVNTVTKLKTFNKHPIVINPAEQRLLSELNVSGIKEHKLKLKGRDKLEKIVQDIKCSFCMIAKYNILKLTNIVEELKRGEPFIHNEATLIRLKQEAEIIVRLILLSNFETGKWLWSYFFKIIAIRQYDDNKPFIHENPFENEQLQTGVLDFIESCIGDKYLPSNAMESDLVTKNRSIYSNMFRDLRDSGWFLDIVFNHDLVTVEFLYLKPFWDDEDQLLFRQIVQVNVDWSVPKQRHEAEAAITREFVENRTWIYKPYGRLDHQHLLIKIIDARIYCHLSVILHVYEKRLSSLNEHTLRHVNNLIFNVIYAALTLTSFKDNFLVAILSEFQYASDIKNIDDIKDILARVRTKANEILNDLNGASTNAINRLSLNVNENQLSTNDLIRIIKDFDDYLIEFTSFLPFEYLVFLHYMDVIKISASQQHI